MVSRVSHIFKVSGSMVFASLLSVSCGASHNGNGSQNSVDNSETKATMIPMNFNSGFASKSGTIEQLVNLSLLSTWSLNVNILCLDAFGAGHNYSMTRITLSNSSSSLFLPSNSTNCTLTINTLNDGTNTYSATGSQEALTINASAQTMSSTASSQQYKDGSSDIIYLNGYGTGGNATIDYASDSVTSTTATNSTLVSSMAFSVNQVTAATAPTFTLYTLQTGSSTYTDTLSASASWPSTCKIISSTASGFLATTNWSNVNADYALSGAGVVSCTSVTLGSQGNWDSIKANDQYIVIATPSSDSAINAYTVTKVTAPAH